MLHFTSPVLLWTVCFLQNQMMCVELLVAIKSRIKWICRSAIPQNEPDRPLQSKSSSSSLLKCHTFRVLVLIHPSEMPTESLNALEQLKCFAAQLGGPTSKTRLWQHL